VLLTAACFLGRWKREEHELGRRVDLEDESMTDDQWYRDWGLGE
jgi:hypothetical protein